MQTIITKFIPATNTLGWYGKWYSGPGDKGGQVFDANSYPVFFSSLGILYAVMPIDTTKTVNPWNVTYTQEGIEWAANKLTQ